MLHFFIREFRKIGEVSIQPSKTMIGIATGSIASLVVARAIAALLFGTTPTDPVTFAAVMITLATVALLAGYLPARKASRIDPMVALRSN